MGFDRFSNFLSKSINNDAIEELNINNNIRKIICNHVIFDLNFIIYQELLDIENQINDIIKILSSISFTHNIENIKICLIKIVKNSYWNDKIVNLFNDFDDYNTIYDNFFKILFDNSEYNININNLELSIYNKIISSIINYIEKIHSFDFITDLSIFLDGIPSISKVLEQRRRRIKNYLESNNKKILYANHYNNLNNNNTKLIDSIISKNILNIIENNKINIDNDNFDYFKWSNNRFKIDKSVNPSSNFIQNFEIYLNLKLKKLLPKINININNSHYNGESDLKIFKFISTNNINTDLQIDKTLTYKNNSKSIEYCIHTIDSDFIHQMLVQQTYYNIIKKDINLIIIKYIKNNNDDYVQILDGNLIINNILNLYNNITNFEFNEFSSFTSETISNYKTNLPSNKFIESEQSEQQLINTNIIKSNLLINNKVDNYKIIWDLCLLFYLFGNDHLPSSLEIGPELSLDFFLLKHYQSLNKNTIIDIDTNKKIIINFNNLSLYLQKLNENNFNNITKIILQRFFKINLQLTNILINKLNLNFIDKKNKNSLELFLKKFIINRAANLSDIEYNNLDDDDLRKILTKNINNLLNYKNFIWNDIIIDNSYIELLSENLDYIENDYYGLILYNKSYNITKDTYQDIYNIISDKSLNYLNNKYPLFYDHISLNVHLNQLKYINKSLDDNFNICNDYLKKIYHLTVTQFGNMENYHSDNITFYKYYHTPSINNIIQYISESQNNPIKIWDSEIINENFDKNRYLNSINHHILISPFLSSYSLPENINLNNINNLWITDNIEDFKYKNINIKDFFNSWNN